MRLDVNFPKTVMVMLEEPKNMRAWMCTLSTNGKKDKNFTVIGLNNVWGNQYVVLLLWPVNITIHLSEVELT